MANTPSASHPSPELVRRIAQLSAIPVSEAEAQSLATAFDETLQVVDQLNEVDTSQVPPTHRLTGLSNVWRADELDETQGLTQAEALKNAPRSHQGYFVVNRVLNQEE